MLLVWRQILRAQFALMAGAADGMRRLSGTVSICALSRIGRAHSGTCHGRNPAPLDARRPGRLSSRSTATAGRNPRPRPSNSDDRADAPSQSDAADSPPEPPRSLRDRAASFADNSVRNSAAQAGFNNYQTAPIPEDCNTLTLAAAIDLAYRTSPALQAARSRLDLSKAGKEIAYADFLPQLEIGYRHIAGTTNGGGLVLPTLPTSVGNVAFGGNGEEFDVAELRAQWTLWDFGRTTSKFGQSLITEEIAGLQYVRTEQTVAYDVASAYFDALDAKATADVAQEAVRRAGSVLADAKNFLNRGNAIRNDVLRADVFLQEMQLDLVKAQTAEGVAIAKLNRAIGINPSSATNVVELADSPSFNQPLAQCLQMAVENRREFGVVEKGIANAKLGEHAAESDFLPKVVVGGVGGLQQSHEPDHFAETAAGGIGIELGLYQGGRRVAEVHEAAAETKLVMASGKEVCDQIAYEVKVAFLAIADAQKRIDVARTAESQASENMRVVHSLFAQGDAIPTDVIDAELTLTRAQQSYLTATYDYQTALIRLAYAVGVPPESFLAMPVRR